MPVFSVIVPAHDRASTIERTVRSVLVAADGAPPGTTVEVIVVDDGSTDATAAVARTLAASDPRVQVIEQPGSGVSAARNAGIRRARGDAVAFVDADDEVDPGWLAALVALLDHHALAFCAGTAVRDGDAPRPRRPEPLGPAYGGVTGTFLPGLFAVRRALLDAAGGYAVPLRYSENYELGLRLCAALEAEGGTWGVDPTPLVTIHLPPDRTSHAYSPGTRLESALYFTDTHADRLALDPTLHGSYWAIAGVAAARLDRGRTAWACFRRAARAEPRNLRHAGRAVAALVPPLRRRLWPVDRTGR